jgi:hypothetical protein
MIVASRSWDQPRAASLNPVLLSSILGTVTTTNKNTFSKHHFQVAKNNILWKFSSEVVLQHKLLVATLGVGKYLDAVACYCAYAD